MPRQQLTARRRAQLERLCRRYRVRRLDVFGSLARNQFDPASSDVDLVVEFEPMTPAEHADACFGLLEDLEALFQTSVDLLEWPAVDNPFLRAELEETSVPLCPALQDHQPALR